MVSLKESSNKAPLAPLGVPVPESFLCFNYTSEECGREPKVPTCVGPIQTVHFLWRFQLIATLTGMTEQERSGVGCGGEVVRGLEMGLLFLDH